MAVSATYLSNFYNSVPLTPSFPDMPSTRPSIDYEGFFKNVCSFNLTFDNTFPGLDKSKIFFSDYEQSARLCDSISRSEIQTIASGLKADFKKEQKSLLEGLFKDGTADEKPFRAVLEKIDQFKWEIGGQVRGACKLADNIAANAPYITWVYPGYDERDAKEVYQAFTTPFLDLPFEGETQIEAFILKKGYKKVPEFQGKGTVPDPRVFKPYQSLNNKGLPSLLPPSTQLSSDLFKELGKNLKHCKEGDSKKLYKERNDVTEEASKVFQQFSENFSEYDPELSDEFSKKLEPLFKKFSKLDLEEVQLKGHCENYYASILYNIDKSIKDLLQVSTPQIKSWRLTIKPIEFIKSLFWTSTSKTSDWWYDSELEEGNGTLSDFSVKEEWQSLQNTSIRRHNFTENFQTILTDLKYPLKDTFEVSLTKNYIRYFKGQKELKKLVGDIDGDSLHETFKKRFIACTPSGCANAYIEEGYFFEKQHPFLFAFRQFAKSLPKK